MSAATDERVHSPGGTAGDGARPARRDPVAILAGRLATAWPWLTGRELPQTPEDPGERAAVLLEAAVTSVAAEPRADRVWLLLTAVAAGFPTADECAGLRRTLETAPVAHALEAVLDLGYRLTDRCGSPAADIEMVAGGVVVDVDFSARNDLHTGIQRVVRETMPRWRRDHDVTLVAWNDARGGYRRLTDVETDRVLHWGRPVPGAPPSAAPDEPVHAGRTSRAAGPPPVVVPWHARVVLADPPAPAVCPVLAGIARMSGNRVGAVGYDCIPVVSPDLVDPALAEDFVRYLGVIKHVDVVAALSRSAAEEFSGFSDMLPTQGLPGPRVVEVMLPVAAVGGDLDATERGGPPVDDPEAAPTVLCVGSLERRKNQVTVLVAAERLWRQGLRFGLRFIAGGGRDPEIRTVVDRLAAAGRPITVSVGVTDAELCRAYDRARFTVFVSLHEGYGLPVAESLGRGVPVLASDHGSTAEIAAGGGVLLVDPRDDDAVMAGMRRLLTDDALVQRLRAEAAARPARSWDDYAADLWGVLAAEAPA